MRKRLMIMATKNGNSHLMMWVIFVSATVQQTKSTAPTGGVTMPIQRFRIIKIPKCRGLMPSCMTTGKKIGVKISTAGVASIKVPTTSKIKLMINKIIIPTLHQLEMITYSFPAQKQKGEKITIFI